MVYAVVSKTTDRKVMRVRLPLSAHFGKLSVNTSPLPKNIKLTLLVLV